MTAFINYELAISTFYISSGRKQEIKKGREKEKEADRQNKGLKIELI
jgi:hypothetical protein